MRQPVGIVKDGYELLANQVASSMDLHVQYGGVVPKLRRAAT